MPGDSRFQRPVTPLGTPLPGQVGELLSQMGGISFQARTLSRGLELWEAMLKGEGAIFMGLAGAMVPAGLRQLIIYLIENHLIDCLVSTGANLFHDLHETLGYAHYQGSPQSDDRKLATEKTSRIYDVLVRDHEVDAAELFIADFAASLPREQPYTTRHFLHRLGADLSRHHQSQGILVSAYRCGVPIFCPAIADSVFGTAMAAARLMGKATPSFDLAGDVALLVRLVYSGKVSSAILIGGGTPKNYILQATLCGQFIGQKPRGHQFALQITTDSPQWGGLSGATLDEARSWGKLTLEANAVTIYCDATIALPLLVSALCQSAQADSFPSRPRPDWREILSRDD